MTDAASFARKALALPGISAAPHFDRTAFKAVRIFATLAGDGLSANIKFTPDEQEFKCQVAPELFAAIQNGWGRRGWTTMRLGPATDEDVAAALAMAHVHGAAKKARE